MQLPEECITGPIPNEKRPKEDKPPSGLSRHEDLVRVILWRKARLPGVELDLTKKDVKDAFRWASMHEMGAYIVGADRQGGKRGVAVLFTAVYMALTFGWAGSPGEQMIWAWVAKCYHAAFWPADDRWDDTVPFHGAFLVGDRALIEPDVGTQPAQSCSAALAGIRTCLGEEAVNAKKELEEGGWETRKICWCLLHGTSAGTVEMPGPKIEKATYLLADPALGYGCKAIP